MFNTESREVLRRTLIARLSTIDGQGYPHTVPLWFDTDGDDIVIISDRNTRKVDHISQRSKGCVQIGGDEGGRPRLSVQGRPERRTRPRLPLAAGR